MLALSSDSRAPLGVLPYSSDIHITEDTKGNDTLEFNYPYYVVDASGEEVETVMGPQIKPQYFIETDTQLYVIKEVTPADGILSVKAVVYLDELTNAINLSFSRPNAQLNTLATNALTGTGWTFQTNVSTVKLRSLAMNQSTALDIIKKIAEIFMTELRFDAKNKIIYLNEVLNPHFAGVIFDDKFNLLNIQVKYDTNDLVTRLIPVGADNLYITDINSGINYVENHQYTNQNITQFWSANQYTDANALKEDAIKKLAILSQPKISIDCTVLDLARLSELGLTNNIDYSEYVYNLGDTITIRDRQSKTLRQVRIVQTVSYPDEPDKNTVQLESQYDLMEDYFELITAVDQELQNITTATGDVSGDSVDSIDWTKVKNVQIQTAQIGDLQVTTEKVADSTITTAKIGDLQVTNEKVDSLGADKLTAGTINANIINVINLNASNLITGSIDADIIHVFNLNADNISGGTIDANIISVINLNAGNITAGSLSANRISGGTLDAQYIDVINLDASSISTGTFTADRIFGGTLDASKITVVKLDASAITTGTFSADRISGGTIDASTIDVIHLNASNITAGELDGTYIKAHSIVANQLVSGTITAESGIIANSAIGSAQIADGSITDAKVVDLSANSITAGTLSVDRLIIRGSDESIVYELNNIPGATQVVGYTTINGETLTDRTVTADKVVAHTITANEIFAKTITANEIAANTITASNGIIASIDANKITTGTIDADVVDVINLHANNITSGTINGDIISGGTITGALLKTSNTGNYIMIHEQYLEIFQDATQVMKLGYYDAGNGAQGTINLNTGYISAPVINAGRVSTGVGAGGVTLFGNNFYAYNAFRGLPAISIFGGGTESSAATPPPTIRMMYNEAELYADVLILSSANGIVAQLDLIKASAFGSGYVTFISPVQFKNDINIYDGAYIITNSYIDIYRGLFMNGYDINMNGGTLNAQNGIITNAHYQGLGRYPVATWSGTLNNDDTHTIVHNLGYMPIVQFTGSTGNIILTVYHNNTNQTTVRNYNSGGNPWTGTVSLY